MVPEFDPSADDVIDAHFWINRGSGLGGRDHKASRDGFQKFENRYDVVVIRVNGERG